MNPAEFSKRSMAIWFCAAAMLLSSDLSIAADTAKAKRPAKAAQAKAKPKRVAGFPSKLEGGEAVVYKTVGDIQLKLHMFKPAKWKASDKRPAIVFFFGGGWSGGTPAQFLKHSQYLASRGMVAFTAEYRVAKYHKTSPFECVKDGKSAVRFIRQNAAKLGVDPKRVAAGGGSAGGHVAACTGTITGLEEKGEDTAISSLPNAMALFNPVIDTGPKGYGYSRLKSRYKEISPVDHVTAKTPPTVYFQGDKDTTTPPAGARRYDAQMKKLGIPCELLMFPGKSHGFFNYGRDGGGAFVKSVRTMDRFFARMGWLKGEPTIKDDSSW